MPAFLVTGNPGSGKSTVADELTRRGLSAIDPDHDPDLSHWVDEAGRRVEKPPDLDAEWLLTHRWVWDRSCMERTLAGYDDGVFICGIARNQNELLDLFDQIFLLRIDERTQEERLDAYDAVHPDTRRNEAGRQEIRAGRPVFEAQMLALGAVAIDGTAPTTVVADELLRRIPPTG